MILLNSHSTIPFFSVLSSGSEVVGRLRVAIARIYVNLLSSGSSYSLYTIDSLDRIYFGYSYSQNFPDIPPVLLIHTINSKLSSSSSSSKKDSRTSTQRETREDLAGHVLFLGAEGFVIFSSLSQDGKFRGDQNGKLTVRCGKWPSQRSEFSQL